MKKQFTAIFISFCFSYFQWIGTGGELFAQLNRANKFYENFDYSRAIQLYKKVLKSADSLEAFEKIANAYRLTKNYSEAEYYYARLMKQHKANVDSGRTMDPINYFYYGMVLKNNNKIDEAKEQFKFYCTIVPTDKKAGISVKSCDDIKIWVSKTQQFEISPVTAINTSHSEFGPVIYKNQMLFVSDRSEDFVNNSSYSWNQQPFLKVLSSAMKADNNGIVTFSKKVKSLSGIVNSEYHDGPVCFSKNQDTMYITRVDYVENKKDKNFVNRPKLYSSTLKGKSWGKEQPFQYNNIAYSVAHASISDDGQWLFFASDMPGGQGGKDIWVCNKEGNSWGQPKNLGTEVNTPGDEVFPYIRKDGILYFSSDGLAGLGGLDVFSAIKIDGEFSDVKNPGVPLNSSTDDFGIIFSEDNTKGYFASDRVGGKGSDDIYSFTALNKFLSVSGKLLLSRNLNDPAKNSKVMLLDDQGTILKVSTTDSAGFFNFERLDPDMKYLVKLDETDPVIASKKKYYLADENNKIVRVTVINDKGGKFVFQNLPLDPNSIAEPELGEDISIAGNLLFGENPSKPLSNTKVNLVNEKGEIVQTGVTDAFGAFAFTNLPSDQNFLVKVDENDAQFIPNTKIKITNNRGKEIQTTQSGSKGGFEFSLLPTDSKSLTITESNDISIAGNMLFGETSPQPLANTKVNLVNEKGEIVQTGVTDAFGAFAFTNLPSDQNFLVKVDESDVQLAPNTKIKITNKGGKEIQSTRSGSKGGFEFSLLPTDSKSLIVTESKDVSIAGNMLFGETSPKPLANTKVNLVNEKGEIVQSAFTDAFGAFAFTNLPSDQIFLVKVDENDVQLAPNTKIKITSKSGKEIRSTRSGSKGGFEFSLLPTDSKSLIVTESNDVSIAGNMLFGDTSPKPLANTRVNLINEKGDIVQTAMTNAFGAFVFTNLPADQNFLVRVDESDVQLAPDTKIKITNKNGKEIQSTRSGSQGGFAFSLLASDSNTLAEISRANDMSIAGNLIVGQHPSKALGNVKINLVNEKGEIVKTVITDSNGAFAFVNLPTDQKFIIKVDEMDTKLVPNTKIMFSNRKGKEVQTTTSGISGAFRLSFLASDYNSMNSMKIDDTELRFDMKGKLISKDKAPLANSVVNLLNEKGKIIRTVTTDKNGNFRFENLPIDQNFLFAIDENDTQLKRYDKLFLTNEGGTIIKEFNRDKGKFEFALLPTEQKILGALYVEDPWLKALHLNYKTKNDSVTIVENIYYNYNDYTILPQAQGILDKVINMMQNDPVLYISLSAHCDSRASKDFNMQLSQKRVRKAIDYIIAKGIAKDRITGKGYGETKLVNQCTDGVACSEEEHAVNRRTEFKISRKHN